MPANLNFDLPMVKVHYADILCQLAADKGVDRSSLLAAADLRPSQLADADNILSLNQFMRLNRAALALTGDPGLGLEFGKRLKFTTHGSLSQAAISADTLEESLGVLIKYFGIRFAYMKLEFFTEGDDAVIQCDLLHDVRDLYIFNVEVVVASIVDVNLLLFGNRLMASGRCLLSYPPPAHREAYHALFGSNVEFSAPANQLRFERRFLDLPLALSNPVARRVAEAQCEAEMRSLQAFASASGKVRNLLESVRTGRLPGLETVAEQLHVSPRTLRRQLSQENSRFQTILDDVRSKRAREMLTTTTEPVDEIAFRLGYSDPSNFGRAFRKWEGMSPSAYRLRHS